MGIGADANRRLLIAIQAAAEVPFSCWFTVASTEASAIPDTPTPVRSALTWISATPCAPIVISAVRLSVVSRPVQRTGTINSHAILGGLHHHYVRV